MRRQRTVEQVTPLPHLPLHVHEHTRVHNDPCLSRGLTVAQAGLELKVILRLSCDYWYGLPHWALFLLRLSGLVETNKNH